MRNLSCGLTLASLILVGATAWAAPEPDELMPCKVLLVKPAHQAPGRFFVKFECKPTTAFTLPAQHDPTMDGASFFLTDTANSSFVLSTGTTKAFWRGLGNPPGSGGFAYNYGIDACPVFLLKTNIVKGLCKMLASSGSPQLPFAGNALLRLAIGPTLQDSKKYCAKFGGTTLRNDATQLKRKNAPAPSQCSPSGAFLDDLAF